MFMLLSNKTFVVCGDFNVPGVDGSSIDPQIENLLTRYNLVQHVQATHTGRQDQLSSCHEYDSDADMSEY